MKGAAKVIFVSVFTPDADGHGGNHRSYQVQHDCHRAFGAENVRTLSFVGWTQEYAVGRSAPETRRRQRSLRLWRLLGFCRDAVANPWRLAGSLRWTMSLHHPAFLAAYRAEVAGLGGEVICLTDDTRFTTVLRHNRRAGIRTLLAPHNIQSFHDVLWPGASAWQNRTRAEYFRQEFHAYGSAQRTLLISRVEAGVVGGLGLPAAYYPYRPTGEIAAYCDEVRARRRDLAAAGTPAKTTFLYIGSAGQPSTIASLEWLLDCIAREPLPDHVELFIVGGGTERFAAGRTLPANVSVLGRVPNDDLKELLIRARGMLIPAFQGMGALTRLAEMHRCGLPLLVSSHAMRAVEPMPGVTELDEHWRDWMAAIDTLAARPPVFEVRIDGDEANVASLRRWVREAAEARTPP